MGSRVELFERIRRDREFDGLSTHALARRYGVHRRTVREAVVSAVPPERKRPVGRPAPVLGVWREWIDQILIADGAAPRKQRHTAKRIADRLAEEHGVVVAGSTMRDHVRKRRRELGFAAEAFCEQVHDPGVTAEVDWGEATVSLAGALTVLGLFLMRSCFSGACFVMAFETQCQQAFFEGQRLDPERLQPLGHHQRRIDNPTLTNTVSSHNSHHDPPRSTATREGFAANPANSYLHN